MDSAFNQHGTKAGRMRKICYKMPFGRLLLFTVGLLFYVQNSAGFWINGAWPSPSTVIPAGEEVQLVVSIWTPTQPSGFARPTEVEFSKDFNKFLIKMYPTSGPLHAFGATGEAVSLGSLPEGEYIYEVQLHPPSSSLLTEPIEIGRFYVGRKMQIEKSGDDIVVKFPSGPLLLSLQCSATPDFKWVSRGGVIEDVTNMVFRMRATNAHYFRLVRYNVFGP